MSILVEDTRFNVDTPLFLLSYLTVCGRQNLTHMELVLKRHDREDELDTRNPQRVRFTHKQPDKRTDLGTTDDTVAKRAKLSEPPSSSS